MKFLLLLAIVALAVWAWRSGRRDLPGAGQPPPSAPPDPQEMVRCAHCGVHLPRSEAVEGRAGLYCSVEHRQKAEA